MGDGFNKITSSATKLVLLSVMGVLDILALFAGLWGVVTGNMSETIKVILALFVSVVSFLMGYYFGSKGDPTQQHGGK